MSSHISEDLPRLLTGDAKREAVMDAAEHLRTCPDCQQELVSAVVAHASLTSAHRFAPDIVALGAGAEAEATDPDEDSGSVLPDLSNIFAQARQDATVAAEQPVRNRRRLVAVAAAAAVIIGGGATFATNEIGSAQPSTRTVALSSFPTGDNHANLVIAGSTLKIDASKLQKLDSKHVYELWLTDTDRAHMQSVGSFSNDKSVELPVPSKVMAQYNDFEVSIQKTNQIKYSGVSVLRGQYG